MRRSLLICVLMMTLSLSACGGGGGGSEAEELALTIRGEYLAMTSCAAQAVVTADYGQRVYRYELSAAVNGEEALLTLTAPETVAGLTARIEEDEGWLEYDGAILETGELAPGGLTPMGAIPALLEKQVQTSVYMEDTIRRLAELGVDTIVEIGPGKVLSGFIRKIDKSIKTYAVQDCDSLAAAISALKGAMQNV